MRLVRCAACWAAAAVIAYGGGVALAYGIVAVSRIVDEAQADFEGDDL